MATLEVCSGNYAGQTFPISGDIIVLGRDPFCDVVLPVGSISREHARIELTNDGYYLEDLASLNGTFLNGQRLSGRSRLSDNDRIQLYEIVLAWHENGAVAPLPVSGDWQASRVAEAALVQAEGETTGSRRATIVDAMSTSDPLSIEFAAQAKLSAILEITRNLGRSLAVDVFLPDILDSLFTIFPQAERGFVLMADHPGSILSPRAVKHRRGESGNSLTLGPISGSIVRRVMEEGEAILSTDTSDDAREESVLELPTCSRMTVPLLGPGQRPLGIMHIDTNDPRHCFVAEDLEVLMSVAAIAAQTVEHAHLHQRALRLDQRERELATAKEVQLHFLPSRPPEVPGYQFFDYYRAAEDVGGDYFGYVPLSEGRWAVALGDVSGKGVSAALLMARLCSEVRFCLATTPDLTEAVHRLNLELAAPSIEDRFVTFLLCVIDPHQHTLTVLNAGHMPPLCLRAASGQIESLGDVEAGRPLGFDTTARYQAFQTQLEPGDLLVMYTDGITEATSVVDDYYGLNRLRDAVSSASATCEGVCRKILSDVDRFTIGSTQSDDICLIGFGRV